MNLRVDPKSFDRLKFTWVKFWRSSLIVVDILVRHNRREQVGTANLKQMSQFYKNTFPNYLKHLQIFIKTNQKIVNRFSSSSLKTKTTPYCHSMVFNTPIWWQQNIGIKIINTTADKCTLNPVLQQMSSLSRDFVDGLLTELCHQHHYSDKS